MAYLRYGFLGFCLCLLAAQQTQAAAPVDFTLPDLEGQPRSLSDYRGQWVLVNYWATWCPPCREELPELEIFHAESEGQAVVLGVNTENIELSPLKAFLEDQFVSYPVLIAGERLAPSERIGSVPGLPTSFLVSPQGTVVARQVGPVTADAIRAFIESYDQQPEG